MTAATARVSRSLRAAEPGTAATRPAPTMRPVGRTRGGTEDGRGREGR